MKVILGEVEYYKENQQPVGVENNFVFTARIRSLLWMHMQPIHLLLSDLIILAYSQRLEEVSFCLFWVWHPGSVAECDDYLNNVFELFVLLYLKFTNLYYTSYSAIGF